MKMLKTKDNMSQNESETQESISARQKLKQRTYTYSDMLDAWVGGRTLGEKCKDSTADLPTGVIDFSTFIRKYL